MLDRIVWLLLILLAAGLPALFLLREYEKQSLLLSGVAALILILFFSSPYLYLFSPVIVLIFYLFLRAWKEEIPPGKGTDAISGRVERVFVVIALLAGLYCALFVLPELRSLYPMTPAETHPVDLGLRDWKKDMREQSLALYLLVASLLLIAGSFFLRMTDGEKK